MTTPADPERLLEPGRRTACRRLRLLRLQAAAALADGLAAAFRPRSFRVPAAWLSGDIGRGISIVIPERGTPTILEMCLGAALIAAGRIEEPVETIVVVNGCSLGDYEAVRRHFPAVAWLHREVPLAFSEAVAVGLRRARHPWVYLLNSDMFLEPDALVEAARWRGPQVFAVASQILPEDDSVRREETGWTDLRFAGGRVEILDPPLEDEETTRGGLYAGGGSSLFQRDLLLRMNPVAAAYAPFYWEDAEWGARAWKAGYEVRFCPRSRARHRRRATVAAFFPTEEIHRVFARNAVQFQLRNLSGLASLEELWRDLFEVDQVTFEELTAWRNAFRVFHSRLAGATRRLGDEVLQDAPHRYHFRQHCAPNQRPRLLAVSPFAVYPPAHGGAVRTARTLESLASRFDVVLLSDERDEYPPGSARHFGKLAAVHLVRGRRPPAHSTGLVARMEAHCHSRLREELLRLLLTGKPDLVQTEHMELAPLVESRDETVPWVLVLHDVTAGSGTVEEQLRQADLLRRFDLVVVCSPEDAALVPQCRPVVVPNGCDLPLYSPSPTQGVPALLFAGPFRYRPNLDGIRSFLTGPFPQLRNKVPGLELWILGGPRAMEKVLDEPDCFDQPGVIVYDRVDDVLPFLRACAATINPVTAIRGSSVKLLESVSAGRVCVSTREGARGFADAGFPSLLVAESVDDLIGPLERVLTDAPHRHGIEPPPLELLQPFTWEASTAKLLDAYDRLLRTTGTHFGGRR